MGKREFRVNEVQTIRGLAASRLYTQGELAESLGATQAWVSQIIGRTAQRRAPRSRFESEIEKDMEALKAELVPHFEKIKADRAAQKAGSATVSNEDIQVLRALVAARIWTKRELAIGIGMDPSAFSLALQRPNVPPSEIETSVAQRRAELKARLDVELKALAEARAKRKAAEEADQAKMDALYAEWTKTSNHWM